mmetsp:Transcript_77243/g.153327  ORF Transcript_77243/g.153327 Transcript_77243/m.153327 type:complete len:91 (+) Transcript_77243:1210-1482(+)
MAIEVSERGNEWRSFTTIRQAPQPFVRMVSMAVKSPASMTPATQCRRKKGLMSAPGQQEESTSPHGEIQAGPGQWGWSTAPLGKAGTALR